MIQRLPLHLRLLVLAVMVIGLGFVVWAYAVSHDFGKLLDDYLSGRPLTWPPPKESSAVPSIDLPGFSIAPLVLLATATLASIAVAAVVAANRVQCRRRRDEELETWELRLGRDDITNPFKVQEAFEGIAGSLTARWYERLWSGQDHLALEVHRDAKSSIAFTVAGPHGVERAMRGALKELYPDVLLQRCEDRPTCTESIVRLKKARSYVLSIQTQDDYEHAFSESLVAGLDTTTGPTSVQLVLTPAPRMLNHRSRALLKRRERGIAYRGRRDNLDLGAKSVIEAKELKGALETQHRSLLYFDLRVAAENANDAARIAGLFAQLRSDNEFVRRNMRLRHDLYAARFRRAAPNPLPAARTGVLSTSELATLWQLPRARVKDARLHRATVRRAVASPDIDRAAEHQLMYDERGAVGLGPADRKYGHALIGGQGGGKSSVMARSLHSEAKNGDGAIVLFDPKGPLAELALGLIPAERKVHYLDLASPEVGFNPLVLEGSPGARASMVVQAIIEANPPGAIQAASDSFLRQAISAVCAVERSPTLWHVYRMFDLNPRAPYRQHVAERLNEIPGADFARGYWRREFPALLGSSGFAAQALNPPRNKIERLISTPEMDTLLRHPVPLDLREVIERGEVLIVCGAKATVGEDNAIFAMQLLLQMLHRAVQAQQARPRPERRRVTLYIDEAHNLLTRSVATMLAEGRSAGLEATFAWQYSAQIADQVTRSGLRSLLQSLSIFRMREMDDARSIAGLAMEVYADRISVGVEEQERLRFSADDIVKLPIHQAINLWIAGGIPRPGFVAKTLPMEDLHDHALADRHRLAQRERGAHFPSSLSDPFAGLGSQPPLADEPEEPERIVRPSRPAPKRKPKRVEPQVIRNPDRHAKTAVAVPASPIDDLEELD